MSKNIKELLASWGISKRQVPERNEVLKNDILSRPTALTEASAKAGQLRLPWFSLAFASIAVIVLLVNFVNSEPETTILSSRNYQSGNTSELKMAQPQTIANGVIAPDYYPYPGPGGDITDTREFLKIGYNAAIRTRHISDLSQTIRNIIRGVDGRIDSINISEKSGYVSFAVPASKFDAFQSQIKGLVGAKFIIETINTQNLLPQKQSIEEQQAAITTQLANLRASRNRLQQQLAASQDEQEQISLRARIASLNAQINTTQTNLANTNKQNQNLLNNVATVNGTISLQWISIWEIISLYAGPYWLPILLAIAAVLAYLNHRRGQFMLPL